MRTIENRTEDMIPNALNALLGIALIMMPWYLDLGSTSVAARNASACGIAIAMVAALAIGKSYDWEEAITFAMGLWVSVAPWVLGFTDSAATTWGHVGIGLSVAALAAFELWRLFVSPQAHSV